jgi:hypothetical protein
MRSIKNLKINESIRHKKLIIEETSFEKLNTFVVYFFGIILISISIMSIKEIHSDSQNEKYIGGIFSLFSMLTGAWLMYRKWMEKELITVKSKFTAKEIKTKLLQFAMEEAFEIYKQDGYCLILNESIGFLNGNHKKTRIIFIRDHEVYFAILQDNSRLNRPILTSHLFLKHALQKLLN